MRPLVALLFVAVIAGLMAAWWFKFEHFAPRVSLVAPLTGLGRQTPFDIDVHTDTPGLRRATVQLVANGTTVELLPSAYPPVSVAGNAVTDARRWCRWRPIARWHRASRAYQYA